MAVGHVSESALLRRLRFINPDPDPPKETGPEECMSQYVNERQEIGAMRSGIILACE